MDCRAEPGSGRMDGQRFRRYLEKDENGNGRWRDGYERSYEGRGYGYGRERRAFKQELYDGRCKIERKWERNGEYKEERKCRGSYRSSYRC